MSEFNVTIVEYPAKRLTGIKAVSYTHLDVYKRQRSRLGEAALNELFDPSYYLQHEDEIFARVFDSKPILS